MTSILLKANSNPDKMNLIEPKLKTTLTQNNRDELSSKLLINWKEPEENSEIAKKTEITKNNRMMSTEKRQLNKFLN